MTPLHWAAQNGHAEIATILIRHGAATNIQNKFGLTPSDIAFQIKRHDIIDIIVMSIRDPLIATEHLQLEMSGAENSTDTDNAMDAAGENETENSVPLGNICKLHFILNLNFTTKSC